MSKSKKIESRYQVQEAALTAHGVYNANERVLFSYETREHTAESAVEHALKYAWNEGFFSRDYMIRCPRARTPGARRIVGGFFGTCIDRE